MPLGSYNHLFLFSLDLEMEAVSGSLTPSNGLGLVGGFVSNLDDCKPLGLDQTYSPFRSIVFPK